MRVGLLLLRLFAGGFFLATALWKLTGEGKTIGENIHDFRQKEYVSFLEEAIAHPPVLFDKPLAAYAAFLEHVMLPGAGVFAPAILFFELLLGVGLLLGGVRLLAFLGFGLMMSFNLAKPDPLSLEGDPVGVFFFSTRSANWPVTWILLALSLAAAGRYWGLDTWLRGRLPRWLRWIG